MNNVVNKLLPTAGKALVTVMAVMFGLAHFMNAEGLASMVPVPGGVLWVYFTGVCLIAGGVGIFIPKVARLAGLLLGVLILIFAFGIHAPKLGAEGQAGQVAMISFLKDLGLAGAAWLAAVVSDLKR
ncbi:MAG: DoxX family protein [Leptospiraceae bacterium]|nr:DoxX family protein [Leptospiraceae bacterium]